MSRTSAIALSIALRFVSKFSGAVFFILIPFIAHSLSESTESVQLLVPIFLFGCSLSQFFVGSLADVYGKRKLLCLLLGCFVVGSVVCAASSNMLSLRIGVLAVALGVGAIAGLGNTLIFDGYDNYRKAAKALSFSSILVIWAPALAMNASMTIARIDWRWFFWFQAVGGIIMFWMTWRDVPALPPTGESPMGRFRKSAAGYLELLANRQFRLISARMCLTGGGIVVFYSVGLPHLQDVFGKSNVAIGWIPCIIVLANSFGRLGSGILSDRISTNQLATAGTMCCVAGGAAMIGLSLAATSHWMIVPPMAIYVIGIGLMFSPQRAELMHVSDRKTATSESLLGILMSLSGAVFAYLAVALAALSPNVPLVIGIMLLCLGVGAIINPAATVRSSRLGLRQV